MLSDAQQALVVALVGDTPTGQLAAVVAQLAGQYDGVDGAYRAALLPGMSLELLLVERDLVKVKLGWAEGQVSRRTGVQYRNLSDIAKALRTRDAALTAQIADLAAQLRTTAGVAIGQITITSPISPPTPRPFPDADLARYSGSPYYRTIEPQTS